MSPNQARCLKKRVISALSTLSPHHPTNDGNDDNGLGVPNQAARRDPRLSAG